MTPAYNWDPVPEGVANACARPLPPQALWPIERLAWRSGHGGSGKHSARTQDAVVADMIVLTEDELGGEDSRKV